jgi:1,4-dihydroxy-6-naphthoate synthase
MVHGLSDTRGLDFIPHIADVETLNHEAMEETWKVTKLSFHAWLLVRERYELLDAGAALGYGCGPLLITSNTSKSPETMKVAVPGKYTTARMLLQLWNPGIENVEFVPFDAIIPGVAEGRWDAGVIIHEGRFIYPRFGLEKIIDLGQWWEEETGEPIPLGCIALRRDGDEIAAETLNQVIRDSILHAREYPADSREYIREHARELEDSVIDEHINLYVNDFSLSLGERGRSAVRVLEDMARSGNIIP